MNIRELYIPIRTLYTTMNEQNRFLYNVYLNILKMFTYRRVDTTSHKVEEPLTFLRSMDTEGFYKISISTRDHTYLVFIFGYNSPVISTKMSFQSKVVKHMSSSMNVMLVSDNTEEIKKNRMDMLPRGIIFESHNFNTFATEVPAHSLVPKHEVASEEEVRAYEEFHFAKRQNLPKIHSTDPAAVWCGLRVGQCARITRCSETAGESVVYRYCNM